MHHVAAVLDDRRLALRDDLASRIARSFFGSEFSGAGLVLAALSYAEPVVLDLGLAAGCLLASACVEVDEWVMFDLLFEVLVDLPLAE